MIRSKAADEAPRVALVFDRRPAMGLYPSPLPWLAKRVALREASVAIVASAEAARADVAALDFAGGERLVAAAGTARPRLAGRRARPARRPSTRPRTRSPSRSSSSAGGRANLPAGTFVFVLSDFLAPPAAEAWLDALAHGWDLVPVVIQDPLWERSFPPVAGVSVPVADPRGGGHDARPPAPHGRPNGCGPTTRRATSGCSRSSPRSDCAPILIGSSDPIDVDNAFAAWAEERRRLQWAR